MAESRVDLASFRSSMMRRAMANAATARLRSVPNPWVGAVLLDQAGEIFDGATHAPGRKHAEREALDEADGSTKGSTLFTTLEPCAHEGRSGACTDAIVEAGVARVIISIEDPDPQVRGAGIAALEAAGIDVVVGVESEAVEQQLAPYITHRTTGRPHVILKLAMTLDGKIAAPDGTSQWITGPESRADSHRLRAESDAVIIGAATRRADDPSLTVRDYTPALADDESPVLDPWRVVLTSERDGDISRYEEWGGELTDLLDELGSRSMIQVLVEGGGAVAGSFHRAGLIDEYWLYVAPAIMGGDDARAAFVGSAAPTISEISRGSFVSVDRLGADVRLVYRRADET